MNIVYGIKKNYNQTFIYVQRVLTDNTWLVYIAGKKQQAVLKAELRSKCLINKKGEKNNNNTQKKQEIKKDQLHK